MSNLIYILVPYATRTGGPEALLELAHELGDRARVVYFDWAQIAALLEHGRGPIQSVDFGVREQAVPEYNMFNIQVDGLIPNHINTTVILPEVLADLARNFDQSKVYVWWLSADNGFSALSRANLNHLRRDNVLHLAQSRYAKDLILALQLSYGGMLQDYVNLDDVAETGCTYDQRPDLVAMNANHKVVVPTHDLVLQLGQAGFEVRPLVGLSKKDVVLLLSRARVFVDLGMFPGYDRLVREAAVLGCPSIISRVGAGATDASIPERNKVNPWDTRQIFEAVMSLVGSPDAVKLSLSALQEEVPQERTRFSSQVRTIFPE